MVQSLFSAKDLLEKLLEIDEEVELEFGVDSRHEVIEDLAVMKLYSWRKQDEEDLLNVCMLSSLDRSLLETLVYDEKEAKASSNTALLYNRMVETYEKSFLPRAIKMAKRTKISGWAD